MGIPAIQNSFISGELSPSMLGRQDFAKYHTGCSTLRNMVVSYRGPAYSRAGTKFCGFSKQTGRNYPPRLIAFQFSVNQGLALEFGNFYMRVLYDGAFVTEGDVSIGGVTNSSPAFISVEASSATVVVPINTGVSSSYAPADTVTLAGGAFSAPAEITVDTVTMLSAAPQNRGTSGYAPGNTITLAGGTGTEPILTVAATQVASATVNNGGAGGTPATGVTISGTTGTGTYFEAVGDINGGGSLANVTSFTLRGAYTVNPANLAAEPVVVAGNPLSGATLSLDMGVQALSISSGGNLSALPAGDIFTQGSTSGSGVGATVQGTLFGIDTLSIANAGSYASPPANPVGQASTSGTGVGAAFTVTFAPTGGAPVYNNGDWVYISNVAGPANLNQMTVVVGGSTNSGFYAYDVYGNPVSTVGQPAYIGGGEAARIYTLTTQWAEEDLSWIKVQESADVMSMCCVNQQTSTEYPPIDLERINDADWIFTAVVPAPSIDPPASASASASASGSVDYQFQVTAVSAFDGTESIASPIAEVNNAVDIAATAGTITITWATVPDSLAYYVYMTEPSYGSTPPIGASFGFIGQALGNQFVDSNITPDYTQVPPQHQNPFARGQVLTVTPISGGSEYTQATGVMQTSTGSGAVIQGVVVNGAVVAYIVDAPGQDYAASDTVSIEGDGSGASASVQIGPHSGTYPGVVNYFQERRVYAYSLDNPDTYWMSQPGAYTNFDTRNPTTASDAVTGSPWSVQVNGIQWFIQTPAGLLVMTGLSAWLLAGVGSFATNVQPISPSNQDDVPQAFTGCSPMIQPIRINYDVLYLTSKGSLYYVLPYQLYQVNEPIDITEVSSHLFVNFTIVSHAWCEQPDKLHWAVRSDGAMLSLTYYKTQQVAGWARHDTNGAFVSNCSVVELPVDAHYLATQRFAGTNRQCYMIERMANRTWTTVEQAWCVDAALQLPQPEPNAVLTLSSAVGVGSISGYANLVGGSGYSAQTQFSVVDTLGGTGSGATVTATIAGGVVTLLTIGGGGGAGYTQPQFNAYDPTGAGSGFSAVPILSNAATFTTSAIVFSSGSVGEFIRAGGGIAVITGYILGTGVYVDILNPFPIVPDSKTSANPAGAPQAFPSGTWTLTAPVSTVHGLDHLDGQTVTGLADGNVIPPTVVANGAIALAAPASAVTVGLAFTAQLQSMPLDLGQPTAQGQRKNVQVITARLEASLGAEAVANQVDGSLLSPYEVEVDWASLVDLPDTGSGAPSYAVKPYNALAMPLQTGDRRAPMTEGLSVRGQIALEQSLPLPMNVLALIPEIVPGDTPQAQWPQPKGRQR